MIKNLTPRLAEVGKIKIGTKGEVRKSSGGKEFMLPQKLDHFLVTTNERDAAGRLKEDTAIMDKLGPNPREIPAMLLFDDIELNLRTRYALYKGNSCVCQGDGEEAVTYQGEIIPCPCPKQDPKYEGQDRCKIHGILRMMIDAATSLGGCHVLRTTSYNSVVNLMGSLSFLKAASGGLLAGLPLKLTLSPKTVTVPTTGKNMTIFVVGLVFDGSVGDLQKIAYDLGLKRERFQLEMGNLELQARRLLDVPESDMEAQDIQEEFFPETVKKDEPVNEAEDEHPEPGYEQPQEAMPEPSREEPKARERELMEGNLF